MVGQGCRVQRCSAVEGGQGQGRPLPPGEGAAGQPSQPKNQRSFVFHSQEGEEAWQRGVGPGPKLVGVPSYPLRRFGVGRGGSWIESPSPSRGGGWPGRNMEALS